MHPHRYPEPGGKVKFSEPKAKSVGLPAIWSSLKQMKRYMDWPDALKSSLKMNQKGGFDCPGCAWPDPDDDRSRLGEYCENGIKALAEESSFKTIGKEFFQQHSIAELKKWDERSLSKSGRIKEPLIKREGSDHYEPLTWEEAFSKIGDALSSYDNPDQAIFYTSGRTSNEAAFLYGLLARTYGTNNLPDCSNMCHETSGRGLSETLGIGKGSVTLDDLHESKLILVIGQNPGTNHPRMLSALEKCKKNGGKIIAINPLKEAGLVQYTNPQSPWDLMTGGTDLTDLYLQVVINGDIPLLKAILIKLLDMESLSGGIVDHDFIKEHTLGYEAFKDEILKEDLQECIALSGISEKEIDKAVAWIADSQSMILCWAMGITQHLNGVENVREIVNLLLLRGAIGKKGSGACPVRGHSNVQGDRTMGIWEKMPASFHEKLDEAFGISSPREEGLHTVGAIDAMAEGKARFFMSMGGNFLSAVPDTDRCAEGFKKLDMQVHVSTKLNRSHLITGRESIILPVLGRSEIDIQESGYQFVSVENSMGIVHSSKGVLPPKSSNLKSEIAVVCGIGEALKSHEIGRSIPWKAMVADYDKIRDKIEIVIPGFKDYNIQVRNPAGFYLPNGVKKRLFHNVEKKALFTVNPLPELLIPQGKFRLGTVRSHDQYNTTIYEYGDRYRGIEKGRRVIFIHPDDIREAGFQQGEKVDLFSDYKNIKRTVYGFTLVPYDLPRKCLMAYFPEANPLVPAHLCNPITGTPASKNVIVELVKLNNA